MAYSLEVRYFNALTLKKAVQSSTGSSAIPVWPGVTWNPTGYPNFPFGETDSGGAPLYPLWNRVIYPFKTGRYQWYIEESTIKGGFNNNTMSLGVRAYSVNEDIDKIDKAQSLIISGLLNSRTGYNETNVFSTGENIIKDLDPFDGTIQKLYTQDTNLLIFQENKVNKVLINKNTIYSGDQGAVDYVNTVLGQTIPFAGEYGISTNPESFAIHGFRKYFTDRFRSAVIRLSKDGITEISGYGMKDYFRDQLATITSEWQRNEVKATVVGTYESPTDTITFSGISCCDIHMGALLETSASTPIISGAVVTNCVVNGDYVDITFDQTFPVPLTFTKGFFVWYTQSKAVGGWDSHNMHYTVSLQPKPRWGRDSDGNMPPVAYSTTSFEESILGWPSFYTYMPAFIDSLKNNYYSFIDTNIYQHYDETTTNNRGKYYGATTPAESSITFIFNPNPSITKTFQTIAYEGSNGWELDSFASDFEGMDSISGVYSQYQDTANPVASYVEGQYDSSGNIYPAALTPPIFRAGFDRKENKYVSNLVGSSVPRPGEVIYGAQLTGVKGYLSTCKIQLDTSTQPGGLKELFSVSTRYTVSSY